MSYQFDVFLDRLYCADPESVHSNDKFALAGAVTTGVNHAGFVMPTMTPPQHQFSYFPPDLMHIFSGWSAGPRIVLVLQAWDLDENEGWVENSDTIKEVAGKIADAVGLIPGIGTLGSLVINAVAVGIPSIIDLFVSWDENDVLLDHRTVVEVPETTPHSKTSVPYSVHFSKSDPTGQSSFDYTLYLKITCQSLPLFGGGTPIGPATEHPFQNSTLKSWVGRWRDGDVGVEISVAETPVFVQQQDLRVTVVERVNGQDVTTITERVSISRLMVELFEPVGKPDASNGIVSSFSWSPHLVRVQRHGPKVESRQVLMGGEFNPLAVSAQDTSQAAGPVSAVTSLQYQGDYLMLDNNASLEIYEIRHDGTVTSYALRYRRPSSMFLSVLGSGKDVMLHRASLL
ncbi:MAG: hypothetical protein ACRDGN_17415 [bacterium]